jgi:putative holliday junction resolvase
MVSSRHAVSSIPALSSSGRILAIDYGRKRFGLALSDELAMTAQPLATLARTNRRNDLRRLRLLAREHEVRRIVVGLPLRLDGAAGEMALEAKAFAKRLAQHLSLPVEMVDERLTSWDASQHAAAKRGRARTQGASHDDLAAAIILRDYLAARANFTPRSAGKSPRTSPGKT